MAREYNPITDPNTREALQRVASTSPEDLAPPFSKGRERLRKYGAIMTVGALGILGAAELGNPKPVGYGEQRVQAGSVDEAILKVEGIEDLSKEAARELHQSTTDSSVHIVPERVEAQRDFNPFNNQPEWHRDETSEQ